MNNKNKVNSTMDMLIYDLIEQGKSQREIHRETGVSRDYIRSFAKKIGHDFIHGGSVICMCVNCGVFFKRENNRVESAEKNFCSKVCRYEFFIGENHPRWKDGNSVSTFSKWVQNKSEYKNFREEVFAKNGYFCAISNRDYDLDVHHIKEKAKYNHLAFDVENGLVLNRQVHRDMHKLMNSGLSFEDCFTQLKIKYQNKENDNGSNL